MAYIRAMLRRVRNSRGRPKNAPAAFIHPCRPTAAQPAAWPRLGATGPRTRHRAAGIRPIDGIFLTGILAVLLASLTGGHRPATP
jgi:hypothetical protein